MELEGNLEFSLGCLRYLDRRKIDQLKFPLILQICDTSECRSRLRTEENNGKYKPSQVLSVSDGFYRTHHTFLLISSDKIPDFSVISITTVDFGHTIQGTSATDEWYEGTFDTDKVAGVIIDYSIIKTGDDIGYLSGNPELRQLKLKGNWKLRRRVKPKEERAHNLSPQLWNQMQDERFCDVRFIFPRLPGTPSIMSQRSTLITKSDVFKVQFEGNFADVSEDIPIYDTEPAFLRCVFQFIFTKFVPLLSLNQAFEVLYLAKKYFIEDLVSYCKDFIMRNEQTVYGVTDIFSYFEMNQKSLDDDIANFAWDKFRKHANNYIRQKRFMELEFITLEAFLILEDANCHEWELAQALRRWAIANNAGANCEINESNICIHQLLECIWWDTMPLREVVVAHTWQEFGLHNDKDFLIDILNTQRRGKGGSISYNNVDQYSNNKKYCRDDNFVIYANLNVHPTLLNISCIPSLQWWGPNGKPAETHSQTIGPQFELRGFLMVPSYNLSRSTPQSKVKLTVHLACQGKTFPLDIDNMWTCSQMILTVFSFSPIRASKTSKKVVRWSTSGFLSESIETITFSSSELKYFIHQTDNGDVMDVQMRFISDTNTDDIVQYVPNVPSNWSSHSQHIYDRAVLKFNSPRPDSNSSMPATPCRSRSPSPFSPVRKLPGRESPDLLELSFLSNPPVREDATEYTSHDSPICSPLQSSPRQNPSYDSLIYDYEPDSPSWSPPQIGSPLQTPSPSWRSSQSRSPSPSSSTCRVRKYSTSDDEKDEAEDEEHEFRKECLRKERDLIDIKRKLLDIQIAKARQMMKKDTGRGGGNSFPGPLSQVSQKLPETGYSSKNPAGPSRSQLGRSNGPTSHSPHYCLDSPPILDADEPFEEPARPIGEEEDDQHA